MSRSSVSLEAGFDSLFDGFNGQTEWRLGPSWNLPLKNGVRASFFANWIHGENPLLLYGQEGWNFGVRYTEGVYAGPHTVTLPDVRGVLAFGRGEDRGFGRFDLDLSSPELTIFSRPGRIFGNLDANTIAGTGTDNIYYVARIGIDLLATARLQTGLILYHRSNHTIGEEAEVPNNLNIVQFSAQTPGWDWSNRMPGRLSPGPGEIWYDRLEGTVVPGIVTGSTFTDAQSWDLQAGARFDILPRRHPLVPFVRAFAEWGEAIQREYSARLHDPAEPRRRAEVPEGQPALRQRQHGLLPGPVALLLARAGSACPLRGRGPRCPLP